MIFSGTIGAGGEKGKDSSDIRNSTSKECEFMHCYNPAEPGQRFCAKHLFLEKAKDVKKASRKHHI